MNAIRNQAVTPGRNLPAQARVFSCKHPLRNMAGKECAKVFLFDSIPMQIHLCVCVFRLTDILCLSHCCFARTDNKCALHVKHAFLNHVCGGATIDFAEVILALF